MDNSECNKDQCIKKILIYSEHAYHKGTKGFLLGKSGDQSFSQCILFVCFLYLVGIFSLDLSITELQYENQKSVLFGHITINQILSVLGTVTGTGL